MKGIGASRTINVYKNLTRDIKIYYNEEYYNFLKKNQLNHKDKLLQSSFYAILVRELFKNKFDKDLMESFFEGIGLQINKNKLYFEFASYIFPKLTL